MNRRHSAIPGIGGPADREVSAALPKNITKLVQRERIALCNQRVLADFVAEPRFEFRDVFHKYQLLCKIEETRHFWRVSVYRQIRLSINIVDNAEGGTAVSDNAIVAIENGCTWNLTGNCTLTSLTNNGTINFNGYTITLTDDTVLK